MITSDGWFDWAVRRPGPAYKVNGGTNPSTIFVGHSAVGYKQSFYDIMNGPLQRSVHLFNPQSGPVEQLYPLTAQCWASGAAFPNNNALTMELEGGYSPENEPMTSGQFDSVVRVLRDWKDWRGSWNMPLTRPESPADRIADLYEHKECVRWGGPSTACPSGRYDWPRIISAVESTGPAPARIWAYGNEANGLELRWRQQVFWVAGVEVLSLGDPEAEGVGRLAKNFGGEWWWLRKAPQMDATHNMASSYWTKEEGD